MKKSEHKRYSQDKSKTLKRNDRLTATNSEDEGLSYLRIDELGIALSYALRIEAHYVLRKRYEEIYTILKKIKSVEGDFDNIIANMQTIDGENVLSLSSKLSLTSTEGSPVRVQLRDISGIASNSLAYYLSYLWSTGSSEFGLNNYQLVIVLNHNLSDNPIPPLPTKQAPSTKQENKVKNFIVKVKKSIIKDYKELTGLAEVDFTIDNSFWEKTLFIVDNYGINKKGCIIKDPSISWLDSKTNILVIGNKFNRGENEIKILEGFTQHELGLCIPKIDIALENNQVMAITGIDVLNIERNYRQTFLPKTPTGQGIIDNTNPTLMMNEDDNMFCVGTERRAIQELPLTLDYEYLIILMLIDKPDQQSYNIRPFTRVADWYAAATTKHTKNKLYSYNIGGHLIVRGFSDNYISDLGPIEQILKNIKNEIDHVIRDSTDIITYERFMEKMQEFLKSKFIPNSLTPGHKETHDLLDRPSYKTLAEKVDLSNEKITTSIRDILSNNVKAKVADESLYILVTSLFIAELSRCPQTLLPTIMMLDLCEERVVSWQDAIFQISSLNSINSEDTLLKEIAERAFSNFGGFFPMTHDGSYFQSKIIINPLEKRKLLTWVEYKSCLIMLHWISLAQSIRPDEIEYIDNECLIFGHFSQRFANLASISSDDYGIKINLDVRVILDNMGKLSDSSEKKYAVFSCPKGQKLPLMLVNSNSLHQVDDEDNSSNDYSQETLRLEPKNIQESENAETSKEVDTEESATDSEGHSNSMCCSVDFSIPSAMSIWFKSSGSNFFIEPHKKNTIPFYYSTVCSAKTAQGLISNDNSASKNWFNIDTAQIFSDKSKHSQSYKDQLLAIDNTAKSSAEDTMSGSRASASLTTDQSFYAGMWAGNFIVSPAIHYLDDQISSQDQKRPFIEYYYDHITLKNVGKALVFPIVWSTSPYSLSMANKALVAKIFGDVIFGEANFSLTYASSIFDHLVFSFASFSVAVVGKQSEYYQNYPFVVGILASTSGDIIKLSYDLLSAATHTCHDFIMGKDYFSVTEEL